MKKKAAWVFGLLIVAILAAPRLVASAEVTEPEEIISTFSSGWNNPMGISLDQEENLIIADYNSNEIKKLNDLVLTSIAGIKSGTDAFGFDVGGYVDGNKEKAKLNKPKYTVVGDDGIIYVSDSENHVIRKITKTEIRTFVGNGKKGLMNGLATTAMFNNPSGLAIDKAGNVYVSDTLNHVIRKVTPQGLVTTFAGIPGEEGGFQDGATASARFNEPSDIAFDKNGALIVLDTGNQLIRKIENGVVTTLYGGIDGKIPGTDYAVGGFADGYGTESRFNFPKGLDIAEDGTIFIADTWNNAIRAILPSKKVITICGTGEAGFADGKTSEALLNGPTDLVYTNGTLYITDSWNNAVRKLEISLAKVAERPITNMPVAEVQFAAKSNLLQVAVNRKVTNINTKEYMIKGGKYWVSIHSAVKLMNAKVRWDEKTNVYTVTKGKKVLKYKAGMANFYRYNKVSMVDLRDMCTKLGLHAYCNPELNAFILY